MVLVYASLFFYLGSIIASFLHLVAVRIPRHESIGGRSKCDYCGKTLKLYEVIPLFGYLINRGRCRYCKQQIPIDHLLYELLGGVLFSGAYLLLGMSMELGIALVVISVMFSEAISDIQKMIVMDSVWIIGAVVLLVIRILHSEIFDYLLSAMGLFLLMLAFQWIGKKVFKREAIGGGDVKLYFFIGLGIGFYRGVLSLFLASLFGLIYALFHRSKWNTTIPLVPFIGLGTLVALFFGTKIIDWYIDLMGMWFI